MQGRRKRGETRLPGGAFYEEIDAMGGPRRSKGESIEALEEAVQIIHAFWSSNRSPRFEGKYHTVKGSRPGPYPAHPIGLWLGFYGPRSLALTGQLADGWLPSSSYAPPERLPQMQQRISDAALSAGRQPQDIRRIYNIMGLITTTPVQDLLVGPADHWVEELIRLVVEIGIDTFIYWPATDPVGQIGLFAAEIVPAVQKQVAGVRDTS